MAPETQQLSSLSNPLVTPEQLITTSSQLDQIPADLEQSLRFAAAQLTQAAGVLLRLPQEIIARAIVILYRFYVGAEGGSFRINAAKVRSRLSRETLLRLNCPGCLGGMPLSRRQTLLPPSTYSHPAKRLHLPHLPRFSPQFFYKPTST